MARVYMNRKADETGKIPEGDETIKLIQALGFRHESTFPSKYLDYLRHREVDGITVIDNIATGSFIYGGSPEGINSRRACYFAESRADGNGILKLKEQGKDISEIFQFHSARQSELEAELSKFFEIVLRVN